MRAKPLCETVVLASFLLFAGTSHAQDARDPAAAEELFRQGRAASEQQDYATACAKFRESNRLDPAVGTVFNIADCEEKLGRLATSWTLFEEVVQQLPSSDDRRAIAEKRAQKLGPRVPKLSIHLARSTQPNIVVRRDGVSLGNASLDTALPVDPGDHVVSVKATGTRAVEFHANMTEGQNRTLEVAVGEPLPVVVETSTTRLDTETAKPSGASAPTAAYVVGGLGAAGFITGLVAGLLTLNAKHSVDADCIDKRCSQAGLNAASSGKIFGVVTTVGLVTGAVGLGAATYLFLSTPTPGEQARSSAYLAGFRSTW